MLPMSWQTRSTRSSRSTSSTPAMSWPCVFFVVATLRTGGEPHPAQIRRDHCSAVGEVRRKRHPHVAGFAVAVEQQDSRPLAADSHMEGGSIRLDFLGP